MKSIFLTILTMCINLSAVAAEVVPGTYAIDTDHSNVGFSVSHLGISLVVGRFNSFSGTFVSGEKAKVEVSIDSASIDTKQSRRDKHLRSSDFFDVNSFPKIKFVSSSLSYNTKGSLESIKGQLTLHGESKEIEFSVTPVGNGTGPRGKVRAGFLAKAKINRSDFGMTEFLAIAGDEIEILINIEGIKQ